METLFALVVLLVLLFVAYLFFLYLSNFIVSKVGFIMHKSAQTMDEKHKNKSKLLNAISTIHSTNNANTLNNALKDFRQSIKYHQTYNIKFLDKDLGKLNLAIEKFTKYKAFKLYGLDQQKDALREYEAYIKKSA